MSTPVVAIPNPAVHGDYDNPAPRLAGVATLALPQSIMVRLGRVVPKSRPKAVRLSHVLNLAQIKAALPAKTDYYTKGKPSISRMYLNDTYGDCVIAEKFHKIGVWTGNDTDTCVTVSDSEILRMYNLLKAGPGDSGCVISDVLDYWKRTGLSVNGVNKRIDDYVAVDWRNKLEIQTAIYLFGQLTLGIDLPNEWLQNPTVWDTPQSGIVGGHDVGVIDFLSDNSLGDGLRISTWGGTRFMPFGRFNGLNSNTECYACLGPDWYNDDRLAPNGIDVQKLKDALAILGGGNVPPLPDPTPPTPPIPPVPPPNPEPPPMVFPNYSGQMSFRLPLIGTINGTVNLSPGTSGAFDAAVDWHKLLRDSLFLGLHLLTQNWAALASDLFTILSDLGIAIPHAARSAQIQLVVPVMELVKDIGALVFAIGNKDLIGAIAAAKKILADLSINLGI